MEVDSKEQYPDSIFESFEEEDAVEIIKRFNAYPQLIEAFQWFCDRVDKGEVKSVQTYARFKELLADTAPPAQDGPLPFTVVFWNADDEDVEIRHCTASSIDKADHITDGGRVIAIYPGHLQNLVK